MLVSSIIAVGLGTCVRSDSQHGGHDQILGYLQI